MSAIFSKLLDAMKLTHGDGSTGSSSGVLVRKVSVEDGTDL